MVKPAIYILNGPNLNLIGEREPDIYGSTSFSEAILAWQNAFPDVDIRLLQSNHEGQLIDWIHEAGKTAQGIVLNAGALSHYSFAIRDAISCCKVPVIEVHLSNPLARDTFRHEMVLSAVCKGTISGLGMDGYRLALAWFSKEVIEERTK